MPIPLAIETSPTKPHQCLYQYYRHHSHSQLAKAFVEYLIDIDRLDQESAVPGQHQNKKLRSVIGDHLITITSLLGAKNLHTTLREEYIHKKSEYHITFARLAVCKEDIRPALWQHVAEQESHLARLEQAIEKHTTLPIEMLPKSKSVSIIGEYFELRYLTHLLTQRNQPLQ